MVRTELINNTRLVNLENVKGELGDILRFRDQFDGSFDRFLSSLLLSCQDFIVECQVGLDPAIDSRECCSRYFDETPHLTVHGTCFGTKTESISIKDDLTITTRHDVLEFDPVSYTHLTLPTILLV